MNAQWKQFLLSLVNATLLLAIVLAVLGLVLLNKVESFIADIISDVKFGLLQEIDKDITQVAGAIRSTEEDLRLIAQRLDMVLERPTITLSPDVQREIRSVKTELKALRVGITQLTSSHEALSDHAIRKIAATIAETYIDLRHCRQ